MFAVTVSLTLAKTCRRLATDSVADADSPGDKSYNKSPGSRISRPNSRKCGEYVVVICAADRKAINVNPMHRSKMS